MSILKNLKRKKETLDVRKASQVIANINKIIDMGLLKVDLSTRAFYIEPTLWENRDKQFKSNWSKSVVLYWNASTGNTGVEGEFTIYNIIDNSVIGTYSFNAGFFG
jgi:hypothetical protein